MPEQPPYLHIADLLRQRLSAGEWAPRERLPSRARLAVEYGVGDAVVRRAQELLISEGLLDGRSGSGTYVAEPRERTRMVRSPLSGRRDGSPFGAGMAALGKTGTWENQTSTNAPAPPEIAARLGIEGGDRCVFTRYEFLAEGRPVQLSTSWEPYAITGGTIVVLPESGPLAGRGVIERMAEIGIAVSHTAEQPEPGQATAAEAQLLGVPRGALVTRIQRTYYGDDGRPVETADIVVPATHCEIIYEVPVNPES